MDGVLDNCGKGPERKRRHGQHQRSALLGCERRLSAIHHASSLAARIPGRQGSSSYAGRVDAVTALQEDGVGFEGYVCALERGGGNGLACVFQGGSAEVLKC